MKMLTKFFVCAVALLSLTTTGLAQEKPTPSPSTKPAPKATKKSDETKPAETKKPAGKKSEGKKAFEGTVALNKATAKELESLPGIGPATAARILDYRKEQGKFTDISQLLEIKGIGEKKLAQLRPHLTLD